VANLNHQRIAGAEPFYADLSDGKDDGLRIIEPATAEHGANGALSLTAARCTMVRWNFPNLTFAD
ncbi:MAG: hypothetical protein KAY36_05105, partial [Aeromonadaceae bacterium]|nr:hypothetical protein [Aeromonadaceae bacterium]